MQNVMFQSSWRIVWCLCGCLAWGASASGADDPPASPERAAEVAPPASSEAPASNEATPSQPAPVVPTEATQENADAEAQKGRKFPLVRVAPEEAVWIDLKRKLVAVVGKVC